MIHVFHAMYFFWKQKSKISVTSTLNFPARFSRGWQNIHKHLYPFIFYGLDFSPFPSNNKV